MKDKTLVSCVRDFNMNSSLDNAVDVYEMFISMLRENNLCLEDVIVKAVKNRYKTRYQKRQPVDLKHVTKDCFVDALIEVATIED